MFAVLLFIRSKLVIVITESHFSHVATQNAWVVQIYAMHWHWNVNKVFDSTLFHLCIFSKKQIFWPESEPWAKAAKWLCVARLQLAKRLCWNNYCMPIMLQVYILPHNNTVFLVFVQITLLACLGCTAHTVVDCQECIKGWLFSV